MSKSRVKMLIVSEVKDCFGVWEIKVAINGKLYTYPIDSEFIVRKVKKMLRLNKIGKAINLLSQFKITGFNSFEEECDGI